MIEDQASATADHWERVHRERQPQETSWFEPTPQTSLAMLDRLGVDPLSPVIDVGAGSGGLAASLLQRGYRDVTALDVSDAALRTARGQLGDRAREVDWIVADLLAWQPSRRYAVWHDRAVFHFLVDDDQRQRYRQLLRNALQPGGAVVVATFAADGPRQCSGLPTCGYDSSELSVVLGPDVEPCVVRRVEHRTPTGVVQPFTWLAARHR